MTEASKTPVGVGSSSEPNTRPDIDSSTEDYARRFSGPTGEWFLSTQEEAVLRMLRPWPGATLLDVGGGHAQLAGPLLEHGYRVTVHGSDALCARRISPFLKDARCSFVVSDLLRLPFPDRHFDVVTAFRLIAHVPDWRTFIGELSRVARHAVIIDFAATRSLNVLTPLFFRLKKKVEGNTRPYALFKEKDLVAEFEKNRFVIGDRFAQFFLPMAAHRALKSRTISTILEQPFRVTGFTAYLGSPVIMMLQRQGASPPAGR